MAKVNILFQLFGSGTAEKKNGSVKYEQFPSLVGVQIYSSGSLAAFQ